jgi:hypothetical protein
LKASLSGSTRKLGFMLEDWISRRSLLMNKFLLQTWSACGDKKIKEWVQGEQLH